MNFKSDTINKNRPRYPIVLILLILFVAFILWISRSEKLETKPDQAKRIIEIKALQELAFKIKSNKDFDIKDAYYNPLDSSLKIAFTNKDNMIKDGTYSTAYFNNEYHVDSLTGIEGIYLYAYKRGKHLKRGDYKKTLTYSSRHLAEYTKRFDDKYYHLSSGYEPVFDYLTSTLNDPSSLQIVRAGNTGMNEDSTFSTKSVFRAKNAFGALILHVITCNISYNGTLSNIEVDN